MLGRLKWCVIGLVVVMMVLEGDEVGASVNLPLHHWVYEAIERLTALDIIDRAIVVPKPYSRKQAAKYVARAIERVRSDGVAADGRELLAEPLLERLVHSLRPELIDLGVLKPRDRRDGLNRRDRRDDATPHPTSSQTNNYSSPLMGERTKVRGEWLGDVRLGARVQLEADAFSVGHGETRFRENRMGQYYADGPQAQTDLRAWMEIGDWIALSAWPKFLSDADLLGTENNKQTLLQELNAKITFFNVAFEIGRGSLWWGPGYRGSLLLSDHAFPLEMVRLGSDEPFQLPWSLRILGDWKLNTFWGQLERDRDFPRANLFGLRLSYLPTDWLELGFTRLTQFDGRGRNQSFPETVLKVYGEQPNQDGGLAVNEQTMLDFRARVPKLPYVIPFPAGLQLYGELGSEDKWSQFPLPSRAAILGGLYIPQVFQGDTLDLRIEYADTDLGRRRHPELTRIWYNNGQYPSGLRFKGQPLGHWMGTDAFDLFIRGTRFLTEDLQLGVQAEWSERDRGQPIHEQKREAAFDLTWLISNQAQLTFGYTFQRIKNPGQVVGINPFQEDFAPNVTSTNHFLWTNLAVEF